MKKVALTELRVEAQEWKRERATYRRGSRDVTGALAGSGKAHPFEIEWVSLAPGETNWPYHRHARMWEVYQVVTGRGTVRCPEGPVEVGPGDWFVHPPEEPHNLTNTGPDPLIYFVIADAVPNDTTILDG